MSSFKRKKKETDKTDLSKKVTEPTEQNCAAKNTELTMTREESDQECTVESESILEKVKLYFKTLFSFQCIAVTLYYTAYAFGVFGHIFYVPAYAEKLSVAPLEIATIITVYGAMELTSIILIGLIGNFLPILPIYFLAAANCAIVGCFDVLVPLMITSGVIYLPLIANVAAVGLFAGGLDTLIGNQVVDIVGTDLAGSLIGLLSTGFGIGLILPSVVYGKINILVSLFWCFYKAKLFISLHVNFCYK